MELVDARLEGQLRGQHLLLVLAFETHWCGLPGASRKRVLSGDWLGLKLQIAVAVHEHRGQ